MTGGLKISFQQEDSRFAKLRDFKGSRVTSFFQMRR
jgi:hypothetical protein